MHAADILPADFGTLEQCIAMSTTQMCPVGSKELEDVTTPPPCLAGMKVYARAQRELDRIRKAHNTLAPTGCTTEFCQSGRATRLNEPRVGRDRPLSEIQQEAIGFLKECREQGIITSDSQLDARTRVALRQIQESSVECVVTDNMGTQTRSLAGGVWEQTADELEYGIRASWRNSRRCIMRSKHEQLALCDLRDIKSSREMADCIVKGMLRAFNGGQILPTAFVFAPRHPTKRGPMLWNSQILAFAGYRMVDGSVMGDPGNADLTESMIELGWQPPSKRSCWDLLPIVTMAEGQAPYILELPPELKRTVPIIHPRFKDEFRELDLRWVLAPALSRLGFDIGGNQYTASPFIGWFMDAEIGVRNLADSFRYNVLPRIVESLRLSDDPETSFEDLPEFMKLAALSRAQTELNFAVYYSYIQERVTMVDTLTSSADYQKFDQEYREETGYRLPADPYWLAPPQGSIVPLWHQGAAPNYQPKPMICRHVQDPVKAWRRENSDHRLGRKITALQSQVQNPVSKPKIAVFSCSAGVSAGKMAKKLGEKLKKTKSHQRGLFDFESDRALNVLDLNHYGPNDIILIVASTTGAGEIPRNASKFMKKHKSEVATGSHPCFSVFGNGDSMYSDTYNSAGDEIHKTMERIGCIPLHEHRFTGDTAVSNPDWASFNRWVTAIEHTLEGKPQQHLLHTHKNTGANPLVGMSTAKLVHVNRFDPCGLVHVVLDIGTNKYQEMDHIKILTPNDDKDVRRVLEVLGLRSDEKLPWHHETAFDYLSRYVDLEQTFKILDWFPGLFEISSTEQKLLKNSSARDVLFKLTQPVPYDAIEVICKDMSPVRPRVFSVASSPSFVRTNTRGRNGGGSLVELIVKVNHGGRFSERFLLQACSGARIRFSLSTPDSWKLIREQPFNAPLITVVTGSGIGPVRAVLQRRMFDTKADIKGCAGNAHIMLQSNYSRSSSVSSEKSTCLDDDTGSTLSNAETSDIPGPISLFAGFKSVDTDLVQSIVRPAISEGLIDMLELVPSNDSGVRVQDRLLLQDTRSKLANLLRHPSCIVFVCANEQATDATANNLSEIVGTEIRDMLGERYIEEVFRH